LTKKFSSLLCWQEEAMKRIRLLRAELGYLMAKQADLAAETGIPTNRLSQIFNGRVVPKAGEVGAIQRFLEGVRDQLCLPPLEVAVSAKRPVRLQLPPVRVSTEDNRVLLTLPKGQTLALTERRARMLNDRLSAALEAIA
jgi:transcriptional regulator with XRE-family HTH domain